ncbi:MAG: hypothetical protein ACFFAN_08410 [Promethearchaeota archaeon]
MAISIQRKKRTIFLLALILIAFSSTSILLNQFFLIEPNYNTSTKEKKISTELDNPKFSNSDINLLTPEAKIYTEPMSGHYIGTYFGSTFPEGNWVNKTTLGCYSYIQHDSHYGHKEVIVLDDQNKETRAAAEYDDGQSRGHGSVQFYFMISGHLSIGGKTHIFSGTSYGYPYQMVELFLENEEWMVGNGYDDIKAPNIPDPQLNTWYAIKVDWCRDGTGWEGLADRRWQATINGVSTGSLVYNNNNDEDPEYFIFRTHTNNDEDYTIYYDALSFSWDSNYMEEECLDEGLWLSFENKMTLEWMGYSLDGQANVTIYGNTTISMPENGPHTIQVFGNDIFGTMYQSDIRHFAIRGINIITPENKSYIEPMSGYYPATYGFENDEDGSFPKGWIDESYSDSYVKVISEIGEHKKVLECYSDSTIDSDIYINNYFNSQEYGTIEYWWRKSSTESSAGILYVYSGTDLAMYVKIDDKYYPNKIVYKTGSTGNIDTGYDYADDRWIHMRLDFNCTSDTWSIWIDQVKYVDDANFVNNNDLDTLNRTMFWSMDGQHPTLFYIDAIGYSWDPNYSVGDNLNEGLLLSFENSTTLDWMGYSLDGQANVTIYGNTTISMPNEGPHTIQVFGNDIFGTMHQSDIRSFTIGRINIITPENKSYTGPMDGYYYATYGFENEQDNSFPSDPAFTDISQGITAMTVVESEDGHNKVLKLTDNDGSNGAGLELNFSAQTSGTVEFWWKTTDTTNITQISFNNASSIAGPVLSIHVTYGRWAYYDGSYHRLGACKNNRWYHHKINFNCSNNMYEWYIDGYPYSLDVPFYNDISSIVQMQISSYADAKVTNYFDAIGFSWDPHYNIGDNMEESLLLSFENSTNLEWIGYSLDGQANRTILGNTTIQMPQNGLHTIQLFGNNTGGTMYQSDVNFTINITHLGDIITPENQTYSEPMSGYYLGTFGFESDENGARPKNWRNSCYRNADVQVIDAIGDHNKVLECYSSSSDASCIYIENEFQSQITGTIELWIMKSSANENGPAIIDIRGETTPYLIELRIDDDQKENIEYVNPSGEHENIGYTDYSDDKWIHLKIEWNCTSDTYSVWIDDVQYLDNINFLSSQTDTAINRLMIDSYSTQNPALFYIDAIGYSWDPNYNIGDNLNEGLLLNFENNYIESMEYSLDGQVNRIILGNIAIPMPENGPHTIQVFGNDTYGITYQSEIIHFRIAAPPDAFNLYSTAEDPDTVGSFNLYWDDSVGADNYSVYVSNSFITIIDGTCTEIATEIQATTLPISGLGSGIYYYVVVAYNETGNTLSNCIQINVQLPTDAFSLYSNADNPDDDGDFALNWDDSVGADNYSVYVSNSFITIIDGTCTEIATEIQATTLPISGLGSGIYYYVVVAYNETGSTLSNCIQINIQLPSENGDDGDDDDSSVNGSNIQISMVYLILIGLSATIISLVIGLVLYSRIVKRARKRKIKSKDLKEKYNYCPFCYKKLEENEVVCSYCGVPLYKEIEYPIPPVLEKIEKIEREGYSIEEYYETIFIQSSNILKIWIFDAKEKTKIYEETLDLNFSDIEKTYINLAEILSGKYERNTLIEKTLELEGELIYLYIFWAGNPIILIFCSSKKINKVYLEFIEKAIKGIDKNYQELSADPLKLRNFLDKNIFLYNSRNYGQISTSQQELIKKLFKNKEERELVLEDLKQLPDEIFSEFLVLYNKLIEELKFEKTRYTLNNYNFFSEGFD